jgi:hypothetical protein
MTSAPPFSFTLTLSQASSLKRSMGLWSALPSS